MRFQFLSVGKANESYVDEGIKMFTKRITNYYQTDWTIIAPPKNAATLSDTELKNWGK